MLLFQTATAAGVLIATIVFASPSFAETSTSVDPSSQRISTWREDLSTGWQESKQRNVPMVVYITCDPCVYCDAMSEQTWCDRSIVGKLRGGFVPIRLDRDRDSKLLSRIRIPAYPLTLVASPNGKVLSHRVGFQPPDAIQNMLNEAQSN
jgi:protein disulfide-isomerase